MVGMFVPVSRCWVDDMDYEEDEIMKRLISHGLVSPSSWVLAKLNQGKYLATGVRSESTAA
jgi:uncharacterized membrane protein